MSENDDIHKLLQGQARLETKIDASAKEQHSIKESLETIKNDLKVTTQETTRNQEKIKNLEKQVDTNKEENLKSHERIYLNMDKKEAVIMNKVKVWIMTAILVYGGSVLLIYLKG